jgi:hypothetical protein
LQKGGSTLEFVAYSKGEKPTRLTLRPLWQARVPCVSATQGHRISIMYRSGFQKPENALKRANGLYPPAHHPCHHPITLFLLLSLCATTTRAGDMSTTISSSTRSRTHARTHAARCSGHVITRRSSDQLVASSAGRYVVSCGLSRCVVCCTAAVTHIALAPCQPNRNERVWGRAHEVRAGWWLRRARIVTHVATIVVSSCELWHGCGCSSLTVRRSGHIFHRVGGGEHWTATYSGSPSHLTNPPIFETVSDRTQADRTDVLTHRHISLTRALVRSCARALVHSFEPA